MVIQPKHNISFAAVIKKTIKPTPAETHVHYYTCNNSYLNYLI